jgi:hypothetical protein
LLQHQKQVVAEVKEVYWRIRNLLDGDNRFLII